MSVFSQIMKNSQLCVLAGLFSYCFDQPSHVPPHLPSLSPVCPQLLWQEHIYVMCLKNRDVKEVVMTSNFTILDLI